MFGDTITFTVDGNAKVLTKINQDGYGSEYMLRSSTDEYRAKIKHSSRVDKGLGKTIDRHTVELTHSVYATDTAPSKVRKMYSVLENEPTDDLGTVEDFGVAFGDFFSAVNTGKLLIWAS